MAIRKRKLVTIVSAAIFLFLIEAAIGFSIQSRKENEKFIGKGIRVKATILNLEESGDRKKQNI